MRSGCSIVGLLMALGGCTSISNLPHEPSGRPSGITQVLSQEQFLERPPVPLAERVGKQTFPNVPIALPHVGGVPTEDDAFPTEAQALSQTAGEGNSEEAFLDPFAEGESADLEEYDPWESYNTLVFRLNYNADKYVVKPLASGYNWITPTIVQRGVLNLIQNVRAVPRMLNNLLQGKFRGAGIEVGRLLINSTVGIGGLFDPAGEYFELTTSPEDFGQTLGVYGVGPGPYLLIPLWPAPLTLRDGVGVVVDLALDPFNYLVLPFTTVRSWPQVVTNGDVVTIANVSIRVGDAVNRRSLNLETFQGIEAATVDLYSAVRNAYLQRRARAIRE